MNGIEVKSQAVTDPYQSRVADELPMDISASGDTNPLLPVLSESAVSDLPTTIGPNGNEIIDWKMILPSPATAGAAAAFMLHEASSLGESDADRDIRERIVSASGLILRGVEDGYLPTLGAVATLLDFVRDNHPSIPKVRELLVGGRTPDQIASIYTQRDFLEVSLGTAEALCGYFNISADDDEMLGVLSEAIEQVINEHRLDPHYRDIAAKKVLELAQNGLTLADIADL